MQLLDKADLGFQSLDQTGTELAAAANQQPDLKSVLATFRSTYPNIYIDIDRTKALALKIPLQQRVQHTANISRICIRK